MYDNLLALVYANWPIQAIGNKVQFEYYLPGDTEFNPSEHPNKKFDLYYNTTGQLVKRIQYEYDINDNLVSIQSYQP